MKKSSLVLSLILTMVVLFSLLGCDSIDNILDSDNEITEAEALRELESFVNSINPNVAEPVRGVDTNFNTLEDILPDIDEFFPMTLVGGNQVSAEIFVAPERGGQGVDELWMNLAEQFNGEGFTINGQTVSVSIRTISSGIGFDYIQAGVHIPDGYSPSTGLWGQMLTASNVPFNTVSERTAGDVSGFLMRESIYDQIVNDHGEVSFSTVVNAVKNDGLLLGYTNPFVSSVGIDFLVSLMHYFDYDNPMSQDAISSLHEFQSHIPQSFFNTLQLRNVAGTGGIDIMTVGYQLYTNVPEWGSGYVFVPFGVRQDAPLYTLTSGIESEIVELFAEFVLSDENQEMATDLGFNNLNDFDSEISVSDNVVFSIQQTWSENRDGNRPTMAVFVADVSGSMMGAPINALRDSLLNSAQYINDSTYVGLVSYHTDVTIEVPIRRFDSEQRSYFVGHVQNLEPLGQTATFDATLVALNMIKEEMETNPNVRPIIFLLSDGETNRGNTLERITPIVEALGVPVITIGFNDEFPELEALSEINEGISINAINDDLMYHLRNLFNAGM